MTSRICKFGCETVLEGWDDNAKKYIEAGTGGLHTKQRCEEAKAKLAQKNDHGNESVFPSAQKAADETYTPVEKSLRDKFVGAISPKEYVERLQSENNVPSYQVKEAALFKTSEDKFVDHTAKGVSKVKIFFSDFAADVEKDYNNFCSQKGIKGQGAHDHVTKLSKAQDDNAMQYTIFLYYEEVKQ